MSESLLGASVAETRQNDGTEANTFAPPLPRTPAGAVNAPAATVCAEVIVVCGSVNDASASHATGPLAVCTLTVNSAAVSTSAATRSPPTIAARGFIVYLPSPLDADEVPPAA